MQNERIAEKLMTLKEPKKIAGIRDFLIDRIDILNGIGEKAMYYLCLNLSEKFMKYQDLRNNCMATEDEEFECFVNDYTNEICDYLALDVDFKLKEEEN